MTNRLPRRLACTLVFSAAAAAQGDVITFDGSESSSWHDPDNWTPPGVPTEADRVVIPENKWCQIENDDAFADTIVVEEGGILEIMSGMVLTLDNDDDNFEPHDPDHSIVNGIVWIRYDPDPAILRVADASHTFVGEGAIHGWDETALVEIGAGLMLMNGLNDPLGGFRGGMTIRGLTGTGLSNGAFRNLGVVNARAGDLVLHADTLLEDIEGAVWTVTACKSSLIFDRECLTLLGDFIKPNDATYGSDGRGAMVFNADIKTCGEFVYNVAGLYFNNGACFMYESFSGSLTNPGLCKPPVDCNNPWFCCDEQPRSCA